MNVLFTDTDDGFRLNGLYNSLIYKENYNVDIVSLKTLSEIEELKKKNFNDYDLIFFDYSNATSSRLNLTHPEFINPFKEKFLNFKGRLIFTLIDDGNYLIWQGVDEDILRRANSFVSFQIEIQSGKNIEDELFKDKFVLVPRYTHQYIEGVDEIKIEDKCNKIVFVGRTTGTYRFNGKNYRVEALNRIYNNKFLHDNFDGVLCDDTIIDTPDIYQNIEYNKTFKYVKNNYRIPIDDWIDKLKAHTLNLGIMGHTKLGYRQIQSIATKNVMVGTFDFTYDPNKWLFSEHFNDLSYKVKEDFTDFEQVCEEALHNREKTNYYANNGFEVYKKYYELEKDNSYKNHIWDLVKENFNKINIDINEKIS